MLNANMIVEENKTLLEYRCLVLQQTNECKWIFHKELEFLEFLKSLNNEEIKRISDIDFPLFELSLNPKEVAQYRSRLSAVETSDINTRLIYESNLLILANRWRISQDDVPDEIRYNTKEPLFEVLRKSTFKHIQALAFQNIFVSKFCINLNTLKRLVVDDSLTRVQRNRIVVNS